MLVVVVQYGIPGDEEDIDLYLVRDDLQAAEVARAQVLAHYEEHYVDALDDSFADVIDRLKYANTPYDVWQSICHYTDGEGGIRVSLQVADDIREELTN